MLTPSDLNPHKFVLSFIEDGHQAELCHRLNQLFDICPTKRSGKDVTNGFRTLEDHLRIYKEKAVKKQYPFLDGVYDESKVPKKSKHLIGAAVDIADPDGDLYRWCFMHQQLLKSFGLYCETGTNIGLHGWVHFQYIPPLSGKVFYNP